MKEEYAIDLSFIIFLSPSGTQQYFFLETSLHFVGVLELRVSLSTADACSVQWGMKTESPEEMI